MKNGFHKLAGYVVYVEDGRVLRGIRRDRNGYDVTSYPYRSCKEGGWDLDAGVTVDAFRAAVRRGTMAMF